MSKTDIARINRKYGCGRHYYLGDDIEGAMPFKEWLKSKENEPGNENQFLQPERRLKKKKKKKETKEKTEAKPIWAMESRADKEIR
ncbi:uncharacterized protein LOC122253556 [Penaeus japonicus]|uniref:uncharacterized protein LOC122253556 n=1 Tax=Penaeus japonicus TaxID=27405 RepID=UPI001C714C47|nr:uncharacterized protein LOC122253556 [Penaeus japonicus]